MFENILHWRLLAGSHKFPGPDGGTCITEAAVVAAGIEYRAIQSTKDCPPCFSRVIAGFALRLNELMSDGLRQKLLMPFVTRLAGTADTPEKEFERAGYIVIQTVKRILPIGLRAIGGEEYARRCEQVDDLNAAHAAAYAGKYAGPAAGAARWAAAAGDSAADTFDSARWVDAATYAANAIAATRYATAWRPVTAADSAADTLDPAKCVDAAICAVNAVAAEVYAIGWRPATADIVAAAGRQIFTVATAILDEAIRLGNQAKPIDTELVVSRMEAMKQKARECA